MDPQRTYTAFAGERLIDSGDLRTVLLRTKERLDAGEAAPILIFADQTGAQIDFNLRGTPADVLAQLRAHPLFATAADPSAARTGPGRPKLGVVCREVSLLPRHWEWLAAQPNGISAALRRLVDDARKREPERERARRVRDAANRFMTAMAGDRPGFEEACRALYAGERERFAAFTSAWPEDIHRHLERMAAASFQVTD